MSRAYTPKKPEEISQNGDKMEPSSSKLTPVASDSHRLAEAPAELLGFGTT